MSTSANTKNRYSGYALMPQSLKEDWWLIVRVSARPSGANEVYHVCQVIGYCNAAKKYQQILQQESERYDSLNAAKLQNIVNQQI